MEIEDAQIGQTLYFVGDYYDEDLKINNPVLMRGTVIGVYLESESIKVQWDDNPTDDDDEQSAYFFFPNKEQAISAYIDRHTEDLIAQSLVMQTAEVKAELLCCGVNALYKDIENVNEENN